MPALTAQHLRKSFGVQVVLEDASFALARGERVALIGANGAGKSTLAKILAGAETSDGGTVALRRGLSVRYLPQEPDLDPAKSARDAVVEAIVAAPSDVEDGRDRAHEALGLLDQLGVRDVDRPCGARSGGERRRIAIARLLVARPDVAILDEPTNHLDADTAEWLEDRLASDFTGAILLVTHDRYFLDAIAQRILELERGRLTSFPGGYGAYLDKRAELLAHEERVEQNRQNVLRRERAWLARGARARSTKQKARIQRALALDAQGAATAGRPGEVELVGAAAPREGKTILELKKAVLAPSPGAAALNAPLDLIVSAGDRIGVVGPNGVGKTTLVRAILGETTLAAGELVMGKNTRVAYLDQARAELDDDASIFDDVRGEGGSTTIQLGVRGMETMDLRSYLELFLFDPAKQRQKVGSLSGGERARVALAKVLRQGANLLLFDEPTNDLDLATLGALEEMLTGFGGSVLVVTHDRAFLDGVATSILAFERDAEGGPAKVTRYAGGWGDYVAQRARAEAPAAKAETKPAPKEAPRTKAKSGLTYAERLELEGILDKVEAAEARVGELEAKLADPDLYAKRGGEVAALQTELASAKQSAADVVARWEHLEQKKAGG
ncbi:MAG TPA: ABC-F family ATP-binding cassette domain-containing protein [Polyangiaceae bacterium]